jgi:MFS family permease
LIRSNLKSSYLGKLETARRNAGYLLIAVQVLDGVSAAVLGVLVPLILADVTRGTGRFNLAQGMIGTAVGIGASLSGVLTGYAADLFGTTVTSGIGYATMCPDRSMGRLQSACFPIESLYLVMQGPNGGAGQARRGAQGPP